MVLAGLALPHAPAVWNPTHLHDLSLWGFPDLSVPRWPGLGEAPPPFSLLDLVVAQQPLPPVARDQDREFSGSDHWVWMETGRGGWGRSPESTGKEPFDAVGLPTLTKKVCCLSLARPSPCKEPAQLSREAVSVFLGPEAVSPFGDLV